MWTDEERGLWDRVEAAKMGDVAHHGSNLCAALDGRLPENYPNKPWADFTRICLSHFEGLAQIAERADWDLVRHCWDAVEKAKKQLNDPWLLLLRIRFFDYSKYLPPFLEWRKNLLSGVR